MSDGYGTPIRLHFDAGHLNGIFGLGADVFPPMELQALSIALSVERKVGGMPLPLMGGKRLGIDLNMVNSTIVIEGIFTDDDVNRRNTAATSATAQIDFAVNHADLASVGKFTQVPNSIFANFATGASKLTFTQKDGTAKVITFSYNSTANYSSIGTSNVVTSLGVTTVNIKSDDSFTPANMAASIVTALGASHLNSSISAVASTSEFVPAAGSSKVTFTQTTTGKMSNLDTLFFSNSSSYNPYHLSFTGGSSASTSNPKSGGDKAQDLYGILHNTDRGTAAIIVGAVMGAAAVAVTAGTGGAAAGALAAGAGAGGGAGLLLGMKSMFNGDYPIGIQIPYNSMITAENGKKYAVRNFLIRTGIFKSTNDKISDFNDHDANAEFDTGDDTTGIQGTIQKLDIGYNAGEQHYTYQMVFAPIDMII
ncbi:MAG: hypothetical protein CMI60_03070 [Parvibaculum sp.]|nr:hypothetical protein [Parvibaculum sp.]